MRKNVKDSDDKGAEADLAAGDDPVGGVVPGGPVDDTAKKNKKAKVGLPWEPTSFYSVEVPERDEDDIVRSPSRSVAVAPTRTCEAAMTLCPSPK